MKKMVATLGILVLTSSLLVGCGTEKIEEKPKEEMTQSNSSSEAISLKRWEGRWTSLENVLSSPEALKFAEHEAKEEGIEPKLLIEVQTKRLMSPASALEVSGDKITLYKASEKLSEASYHYDKSEVAPRGGEETSWDIFVSEDKNALYPYIAFSETHGDEGYAHFHAKFSKTLETLFQNPENDPTFIDEKTPVEIMAEEVFE